MTRENQQYMRFEEVNSRLEQPVYPVVVCKGCRERMRITTPTAYRAVRGDGLCTACFRSAVRWARALGDNVGKSPRVGNLHLRTSPRWREIVKAWVLAQ